jgi:hypothetical protein
MKRAPAASSEHPNVYQISRIYPVPIYAQIPQALSRGAGVLTSDNLSYRARLRGRRAP